jgi:hypothetical protein
MIRRLLRKLRAALRNEADWLAEQDRRRSAVDDD